MKIFWFLIACASWIYGADAGEAGSPAPATQAAPKVVFKADFEAANALRFWGGVRPGISVGEGRTGLGLAISRPAASGAGHLVVSTVLPAASLRGCRVRCEAYVRAANVAQPPKTWNGIKVMLHTDSASEGPKWEQQNNLFGSFEWRRIRFTSVVPEDITKAELVLGLENTSGEVWFDDVTITVLRDFREQAAQVAPAGPRFKGHALARLRGAMVHPNISAESLGVLGSKWKANVLRWQLIRYVAPGKETSLTEYEAWLDTELQKMDRILSICATQQVQVVIDLHSPPGGSRTVSGYIGSDTGLFTNKAAQAKFVEVWQRMAQRYRDNPGVWGYDLANEPVEDEVGEGCDDWQELATRTAEAIRSIDSRHAIIVEPSPWGGPGAIRNLEPIPVPGVVYSVHMYVPHQFTHQGIQGNAGGIKYPGLIAGRQYDKAALRKVLQPVIDFQRRNNVHIFLGEFSAIRWAPGAADYLRDCIELFEEHDWDWTYHAFREYHGWSVEHDGDPKNTKPATAPTDRQRLLLEWFGKNQGAIADRK